MDCVELTGAPPTKVSTITTPANDPVIVIARSFEAPRTLVWRCYTEPRHLVHFWGPKGATNPVSEVDLRVGGAWRQVMRFASGNEYGYTSAYIEISPVHRLVWRDAPDAYRFGDELPPAVMVTEMTLTEQSGRTSVTITVRFTSLLARDEAVKQGFATTVSQGSDKLDLYLFTLGATAAFQQE
jgi:uncharacterized protein YndB with AHSA1/START domain